MSNVPSSAILAIVAIVAACIFCAFIFTTVQAQKENGGKAETQAEQMETDLDEDHITQYDGQIVSGQRVVFLLKNIDNIDVSFIGVDNSGNGVVAVVSSENKEKLQEMLKNKSSSIYVDKNNQYIGEITREENGNIKSLIFTKTD